MVKVFLFEEIYMFQRVLWALLVLGMVSSAAIARESIKAGSYQIYFSPDDALADRLIDLIDEEDKSIFAAVYCLMHPGIVKALQRAKERGVEVEVLVDPFSVKARSPLKRLVQSGVTVFVWDPLSKNHQESSKKSSRRSLMHDKFCLFGRGIVWTGSFNFTREAHFSNCENAIVLRDLEAYQRYYREYQEIKKSGCRSHEEYLILHGKR